MPTRSTDFVAHALQTVATIYVLAVLAAELLAVPVAVVVVAWLTLAG